MLFSDTSPKTFGIYPAPPELTPSPQTLSPPSAYTHSTPSPYNRTPTALSPNHQHIVSSVGPSVINNVSCPNSPPQVDIADYNAFSQQQQQQQQQQYNGNNFGNASATHWETKFNPATAVTNNNLNNLINANAFTIHNLLTPASANVSLTSGIDGTRNNWNLRSNHYVCI